MTPTPTGERKCCEKCFGVIKNALDNGGHIYCADENCECHSPIPAREGFKPDDGTTYVYVGENYEGLKRGKGLLPAREEADKALEGLLFDYGNICVKASSGDETAKTQEGIKIGEIKALINTNRSTLLSQLEASIESRYGKDGGAALVAMENVDGINEQRPALGEILAIIRSYKGK